MCKVVLNLIIISCIMLSFWGTHSERAPFCSWTFFNPPSQTWIMNDPSKTTWAYRLLPLSRKKCSSWSVGMIACNGTGRRCGYVKTITPLCAASPLSTWPSVSHLKGYNAISLRTWIWNRCNFPRWSEIEFSSGWLAWSSSCLHGVDWLLYKVGFHIWNKYENTCSFYLLRAILFIFL